MIGNLLTRSFVLAHSTNQLLLLPYAANALSDRVSGQASLKHNNLTTDLYCKNQSLFAYKTPAFLYQNTDL